MTYRGGCSINEGWDTWKLANAEKALPPLCYQGSERAGALEFLLAGAVTTEGCMPDTQRYGREEQARTHPALFSAL